MPQFRSFSWDRIRDWACDGGEVSVFLRADYQKSENSSVVGKFFALVLCGQWFYLLVAAGVYFCRMEAGKYVKEIKLASMR